jgi:vacuolar-type H+-ATPase subunit F/Vma7
MGRVVVLGERSRVAGFALAGAQIVVAETPEAVRLAVAALDEDVDVVLMTPAARSAGDLPTGRLVAVMPS